MLRPVTRCSSALVLVLSCTALLSGCSEDPAAGGLPDATFLDSGDVDLNADLADRGLDDAPEGDAVDDATPDPGADVELDRVGDGLTDYRFDDADADPADTAVSDVEADADAGAADTSDDGTSEDPDATEDSAGDTSPDATAPDATADAGAPDADAGTSADAGDDAGSFPDTPVNPYGLGPYATTRSDVEIVVEPPSGGGWFGDPGVTLDVDLWLPEGSERAPLLIFAPGFQLSRTNYRELGRRAASHGIITLVPSFGDGALNPTDHADLADYLSLVLDWALAQSETSDTALSGRLDPRWLVVGGHSRGGKIAFLTAINDDRFDATVTFDPVDSTGNPIFPPPPTPENPSVAPELMGGYTVPGLMFGAGRGGEGTVPCAPTNQNYESYWSGVTSSPFVLLVQAGAGHLDFATDVGFIADLGCTDGDTPDETRSFAYAAGISFVRAVVLGDERYDDYADGTIAPAGTEVRTR